MTDKQQIAAVAALGVVALGALGAGIKMTVDSVKEYRRIHKEAEEAEKKAWREIMRYKKARNEI